MSLRTGIAVRSLSGLAYAAELSGTNIETVEIGVRKLAKNMSDAQTGMATQVRTFEQMGVAYENADGTLRDVDDVFTDIVGVLSEMADETKRTALAQEAFGRAGAQLLPMIKSGAKAVSEPE